MSLLSSVETLLLTKLFYHSKILNNSLTTSVTDLKIENSLITSLILELFNPCALEKDIDEVPSCEEVVSVVQKHKNELPSKELICE